MNDSSPEDPASAGSVERRPARWRRVPAVLAALSCLGVTALMWSDGVVTSGVSKDVPLVPRSIERPVQELRSGWGDADAHVLLWMVVAALVAAAARRPRDRRWLLGALAVWTVVVEVLQPVLTELREARVTDALAGLAGIAVVAVVAEVLDRRRAGRRPVA